MMGTHDVEVRSAKHEARDMMSAWTEATGCVAGDKELICKHHAIVMARTLRLLCNVRDRAMA